MFLFIIVCFLKCHKIVSDFHNLVQSNLKNSIARAQNSDTNYLKTKRKDALNIIFCGKRKRAKPQKCWGGAQFKNWHHI